MPNSLLTRIACEKCEDAAVIPYRKIDWLWSLFEKECWMQENEENKKRLASTWFRCPVCKRNFELKGSVLHSIDNTSSVLP